MGLLVEYALSFLGVWYKYGGNNRLEGMDCSSYVSELLRSVGLVGNREDLRAQEIYQKFFSHIYIKPATTGTLHFYGKDLLHITHVAFQLDAIRVIEAGGGDSTTLTIADAAKLGAMVRIRPITMRSDLVASRTPKYPWE